MRVAYTRRRRQVVRAAPKVLFIIHYLRMRSFKNDRENWSGQTRTSRTACYGHGNIAVALLISSAQVHEFDLRNIKI